MQLSEIKNRLHRFNLSNDWSVFNDVPVEQQHQVLYPHVLLMRQPDEADDVYAQRRKQQLNDLFGPLSNTTP